MPVAPITIVSGLPRSGTSLMMQMLAAGGMAPLTDGVRVADADNPRGYLEFERVKRVKSDHGWLPEAEGKVVKMVHLLLRELPLDGFTYRVVWMRRRIEEVLASQRAMLQRQGKSGAAIPEAQLAGIFSAQMDDVERWMTAQSAFTFLSVTYHELVAEPASHAARLNQFLGGTLDERAMTSAVDPALYRQRPKPMG